MNATNAKWRRELFPVPYLQEDQAGIESAIKGLVERFVRSRLAESVIDVKIVDVRLAVFDKVPVYEIEGEAVLRRGRGGEDTSPFRVRLHLETGRIISYEFGGDSEHSY